MSTRLHFDANTPHGSMLAKAIDEIYLGMQKMDRILAASQAMTYGGDYAQLEAEMGLLAGQGSDMAFKLQAISDKLHAATLVDCLKQLDQG